MRVHICPQHWLLCPLDLYHIIDIVLDLAKKGKPDSNPNQIREGVILEENIGFNIPISFKAGSWPAGPGPLRRH